MQDNKFRTWDNYSNQYWPAEYMLDRNGHVRHVHFGEGEYDQTEGLIRKLLGASDVAETKVPDVVATGYNTPESYLGYKRLDRYSGTPVQAEPVGRLHLREDARRATGSRTTARGASRPRRSSPGATPGCGCASRPTTSTSCWAVRATSA